MIEVLLVPLSPSATAGERTNTASNQVDAPTRLKGTVCPRLHEGDVVDALDLRHGPELVGHALHQVQRALSRHIPTVAHDVGVLGRNVCAGITKANSLAEELLERDFLAFHLSRLGAFASAGGHRT